jgi:hypothetical protein
VGVPKTPAPPELKSKDWLERAYHMEGRSGPDIAKQLGLRDASLVYRYLVRHDIPRRARSARSKYAEGVEKGIRATLAADRLHKRRPNLSLFMARVRAVIAAKAEKQSVALRGALIDLAALCQAWAEQIPFTAKETVT